MMNKIQLMNQAKEKKQKQSQLLEKSQDYNLLQNKMAHLRSEFNDYKILYNEQNCVTNNSQSENAILNDLLLHDKMTKLKEYSEETMNLALKFFSISPNSYSILTEALPFPPKRYIQEQYKNSIDDIPEKLTDSSEIPDLIHMWKKNNSIKGNDVVEACLAVDALYFKPDIKITIDNCIKGSAFTQSLQDLLPENSFNYFTQNPQSLHNFILLNYDKIIKAGFVYHIQPYNIKYNSFVVHIKPTPNGKANENIIDLLHEIRRVSQNFRIIIKSYAFDGDKSYKQLHIMFYESYFGGIIKWNGITTSYSKRLRIVSDYKHIIKRLRYRLLSHIIHSGFSKESIPINLDEIKSILSDVPSVVWNNESFTKMNDQLPSELFKVENFLELLHNNATSAVAYWFPITLSDIALNEKGIGFEFRDFLLKCSFYFLIFYAKCMDNEENITLLQRKNQNSLDVMFYDKDILIEFTNTLYSHLQLMNSIDEYNFSRNSTDPLEHRFGFARARSKDVHTLTKFLYVIASSQKVGSQKFNSFNEQANQIKKRIYQSVTVEPRQDSVVYLEGDCVIDDLPFSPQKIAQYFLNASGFNVDFFCENMNLIPFWLSEFLEQFCKEDIGNSRKLVTYSSIMLGTDRSTKIKSRMIGLPYHDQFSNKIKKKDYKEKIFKELCKKKLGRIPTKKDLLDVLSIIKKADPHCPDPPSSANCKQIIHDWIVENISQYFILLDNYGNNSK